MIIIKIIHVATHRKRGELWCMKVQFLCLINTKGDW
jgi:hypothetical protein